MPFQDLKKRLEAAWSVEWLPQRDYLLGRPRSWL
jgi:hypothetical protein